jgi:hypothetical protein
MPHYPDEIEYSDKYLDDYYEYRHVLLPKDVYKKIPRGKLLSENVSRIPCRNGEPSACSSRAAGSTTSFTVPSHTSSSSAGPRILTPRPAFPLPDSSLLPTPSATDLIASTRPYKHSGVLKFSLVVRYKLGWVKIFRG